MDAWRHAHAGRWRGTFEGMPHAGLVRGTAWGMPMLYRVRGTLEARICRPARDVGGTLMPAECAGTLRHAHAGLVRSDAGGTLCRPSATDVEARPCRPMARIAGGTHKAGPSARDAGGTPMPA
ncbi:hypothetical protein HAX54_028103 [Datura stramonium]|uniref:Uncharacterized protein n=1 Tax=Datura stramonium TaxID=4076 RepID=A0ABS8YA01_DATST|nr:hypothetical protein [Datura stramonium]